MNTTATNVDNQPHGAEYEERQNGSPLSSTDELREINAFWYTEELAEPDVWTLASFGDVLPHGVA